MFSSLGAVIALWLSVSFLLWAGYRLFRRGDGSRQRRLAEEAAGLIDEGRALFYSFRGTSQVRAAGAARAGFYRDEELREDVRRLLNAIEANSPFFDRVNATKRRLQKAFALPDFLPLAELLQIRRDFWAASEIFLIEDIRSLGPELSHETAFAAFRQEAQALLFGEDRFEEDLTSAAQDPLDLRLRVAADDATAFLAEVDRAIALEREKDRVTVAEIVRAPWRLVRGAYAGLRESLHLIGEMGVAAQSLARTMSSRGIKGALEELRRAQSALPGEFAFAFERAGGLARQGGQSLKRHYEFLLEARELRARYAELLARAPVLTDKGRQFLNRLELEKHAEQFRETSEGALAMLRRQIVVGIAHAIAGLQYVQAKITPRENKQLAPAVLVGSPARDAASMDPASAGFETPLRARLPAAQPRARNAQRKTGGADTPKEAFSRLRDLVTGEITAEEFAAAAPPAEEKSKPKQTKAKQAKTIKPSKPKLSYAEGLQQKSFKDLLVEAGDEDGAVTIDMDKARPRTAPTGDTLAKGSLMNRLSSLEGSGSLNGKSAPVQEEDQAAAQNTKKSGGFSLFKTKQKSS